MTTQQEQWIDPAVMKAFLAAIPASKAAGDYDQIWPYQLWHASRGWVEFNSLAELEAATRVGVAE